MATKYKWKKYSAIQTLSSAVEALGSVAYPPAYDEDDETTSTSRPASVTLRDLSLFSGSTLDLVIWTGNTNAIADELNTTGFFEFSSVEKISTLCIVGESGSGTTPTLEYDSDKVGIVLDMDPTKGLLFFLGISEDEAGTICNVSVNASTSPTVTYNPITVDAGDMYVRYVSEVTYSKSKGSLVGTVTSSSSSAYPSNGIHTDGYWYVYIGEETIPLYVAHAGAVKEATPAVCVGGVVKTDVSVCQCVGGVIKTS